MRMHPSLPQGPALVWNPRGCHFGFVVLFYFSENSILSFILVIIFHNTSYTSDL